MYKTISLKPKKVKEVKVDNFDLKLDKLTGKVTISDSAFTRLNLKDNSFMLAISDENPTDIALKISTDITEDSFYITNVDSKRTKNKSFTNKAFNEYLTVLGGDITEFVLVHAMDDFYLIKPVGDIVESANDGGGVTHNAEQMVNTIGYLNSGDTGGESVEYYTLPTSTVDNADLNQEVQAIQEVNN